MLLKHPINCCFSGVTIGVLEYAVVAGHMPYMSHWNEMVCMHPLFSLTHAKLLTWSRKEYERIAQLEEPSEAEETLLCVSFLALLHSMDSIQQETVALPPLHIVQSQMKRVFALAYWKHYLNSKRFEFPVFKINARNANNRFENLHHYIDACFAVKEDYETGVNDLIEKEKIAAAEKATKALRNAWIVPASRKELWRWVRAHLPTKYEADAQGWMGTIFLGNDRTVLDFDVDEVDMMQHIIEGECPQGTAILTAVRDRLNAVRIIIKDHKEAFDVDYEQIEERKPEATEPTKAQFATLGAFLKAKAVWYLQSKKATSTQSAAKEL